MTRNSVVLGAALASLFLVAACDDSGPSSDASPGTATGEVTETPDTGVIDLAPIGAGATLDPGTYAVPFVGEEGAEDDPRALVEVPEGYFSAGGWVIDDGHGTQAPDELGDVMFVGTVRGVDTQPCGRGRLVGKAASAKRLATALSTAAASNGTRPRPVIVGGAHGWYVRVTAPKDVSSCPGHEFRLWRSTEDWAGSGIGGGDVDHLWVLDVEGRTVMAVAHVVPGHTSDPKGLVGIVRSARFVDSLSG